MKIRKPFYAIGVVTVLVFVYYFLFESNESKITKINHALSLSNFPGNIQIIEFHHEDFFNITISAKFEFERKHTHELLRGRDWNRIDNPDSIQFMQGATEGYVWSKENKHAEIAFFLSDDMAVCKIYYHAE
jgi:hypothetical protein